MLGEDIVSSDAGLSEIASRGIYLLLKIAILRPRAYFSFYDTFIFD